MHARFIGRKGVRLAAALAVFAAASTAGITSASAASASVPTYDSGDDCGISMTFYGKGETCNDGLMLYYLSDGGGASASLQGDIADVSASPTYAFNGSLEYYTDYVFWSMADSPNNTGEGQAIRNNVASVSNTSPTDTYVLYVYPNFTGDSETFGPSDYYANLNSELVNNEASIYGY